MAWTAPQYPKGQVDSSGKLLAGSDIWDMGDPKLQEEIDRAFRVISNWRASHSFPLNTFTVGLKRVGAKVDPDAVVAQRIKRLSSIELKLQLLPTMKLSQMQDIGGCRAIVGTVAEVYELVELYKKSDIKHKLDHIDDYIQNPKKSGYRSVHLIYRYYSDRKTTYNGLKIEVQLRSTLQHAWATAVEIVGTFTKQALKSSLGREAWLNFFSLMGTAIAISEGTKPVPNTPTAKAALKKEIREYARRLDVEGHLRAYGEALQTSFEPSTSRRPSHYFLLELDPSIKQLKITGYSYRDLPRASEDYTAVERGISAPGGDAVLVSVDSVTALRRAYPNYFFDTHVFIQEVERAIR